MSRPEKEDSLLSVVGTVSGVASLVLAVAGNNIDKLNTVQRWGLALAAAVMLWSFFAGVLVQQARASQFHQGVLLAGGLIGGGLLAAITPFFAFGLSAPYHDWISIGAGASFAIFFCIAALFG